MFDRMETPETLYEYFLKALSLASQCHERKRIAADAGITVSAISQFLSKKKNASPDTQRKIARAVGYLIFEEFLELGKGLAGAVGEETPKYAGSPILIELKHIDTIKRFQNKSLAKTINDRLVELEKINPDALNQVLGYIECKIDEEQSTARSGDRRKRNMPDQVPITGDRRKLDG